MLTTGTVAWAASSWRRSSLPVRRPIAAAWRENTSAVSRTDSPRVSCSSLARSTIGWPPISTMPASIDVRVRVEGCSNSSATVRSSSTREAVGSALSSSARSSRRCSSPAESSSPVSRWRGKSAPYSPAMPSRALIALLLLVLAAGCGEKESGGSGSRRPSRASGGDTVQVDMKDILFVPEKVTARVGQTVRWTNSDDVRAHRQGEVGRGLRVQGASRRARPTRRS